MSSLLAVKYTTFQKFNIVHGRRVNNNKKSRYVDKALIDQDDLTVTHLDSD